MADEPPPVDKPTDKPADKPAGAALMEKMLNHHKDMLEGVSSELPMVEKPELADAVKKHCKMCHKSMESNLGEHVKAYKMKMADYPESLETKEAAPDAGKGDDDEMPLAEDDADEAEISEETEEGKAWVAQLKDLVDYEAKLAADEAFAAELEAELAGK